MLQRAVPKAALTSDTNWKLGAAGWGESPNYHQFNNLLDGLTQLMKGSFAHGYSLFQLRNTGGKSAKGNVC